MFTTFSGSSRRPRQVNLSGRKTHAFGATGTGSGSQAALDRAQQERVQRQRERDTLRAAQTIQRVWRGYSNRQELAKQLRKTWDATEGYLTPPGSPVPYKTEGEALSQLQRLLQFANSRDSGDVRRIQHYAFRQIETVRVSDNAPREQRPVHFKPAYIKLQRIVLTVLDRRTRRPETLQNDHSEEVQNRHLVLILGFLARQIPAETARNAPQYFRTLAKVLSTERKSSAGAAVAKQERSLLLDTVIAPLGIATAYTLAAYEAFGYTFLTLPLLNADTDASKMVRDTLADSINYKLLANALSSLFTKSGLRSREEVRDVPSRLRLLGCFIYFHRFAHNFHTPEAYSAHKDFVSVVSILLNSLPVNIIEGPNADTDADRSGEEGDVPFIAPVTDFLRQQIMSLVNQEGIGNLLSGSTEVTKVSEDEKIEEARQLANYALALLRFFPRRGDEIRMWLYIGPSSGQSHSRKMPAIKYFWEATKRASVFGAILQDSRAAVELLRPRTASEFKSSTTSRHPSWYPAQQEHDHSARAADEWRVILVFLELYTFVLKVTDDEEFFASAKDPFSNQSRDNALPLPEVKHLTTFLKNLGFTLYFNASDIAAQEEHESSSTSISFFSPKMADLEPQKQVAEPSIGGVAGLTLDYVKGLVTGLVRMIYERDSRRKFLPPDHWLMTSRFDMTGFIPSVVQEEESRHRIEEEDAEDMDEEDDVEATSQLIGTSRTQQQRRQERLLRDQRKASRRRYLQAVAPRLEILQNMPFFIPFTTRVQIFREFVLLDMTKRRNSHDTDSWRRMMQAMDGVHTMDKHTARIRRENEFEDAFEQFYSLGQGLKEPIQITFVDQFDQPEAGIDGGGVTKEFLTSVTNRAFMSTDYIDMFVENDQHLLYPNPSAVEEHKEALKHAGLKENSTEFRLQVSQLLQRFEFLGRIIGKCMYEGILVDVSFAPFFLRKWALTGGTGSAPKETGYRPSLNDLRDLDEALYQGLHQLKTYTGDVEDFSLNFTVTDNIVVDHTTIPKKTKAVTKELKPGGSNEPVTNQNRLVYISYMARHRLQNQPYLETTAFLRGLASMIQPSWLSMFNQSELQTLIGGSSTSIDIEDLRRNTVYGGTYVIGDDGLEHPTVQLFWKIMKDFSDGERRAVLKFVTSTPRAPLLGFGTLNPRFSIRDAGSDQERLPSTSTCVNLLKLPMYKDESVLKEKLLYSAFSGAGFDLS